MSVLYLDMDTNFFVYIFNGLGMFGIFRHRLKRWLDICSIARKLYIPFAIVTMFENCWLFGRGGATGNSVLGPALA